MNFVDEVTIRVQAGNGGHGCLSFLREKFIEKGGPDGGDGGSGGNVYLVADDAINTLADFRFVRQLKAENGEPGSGRNKTGKSGEDLDVIVACGTVVHDIDTNELMGDLIEVGQRLMVAEAGCAGLGNAHFKSSTNRAPRKTTEGIIGEKRHLKLELKLLAEVGLVGLPNAGKSTLIRAMSAARPKVANYPFTTLHPNLGVVSVGPLQSFVMADVPGLIAGAAEGAGLGIQFLKHLQRTKLLLHLVDIAPIDPHTDVANEFRVIERELVKFSKDLSGKPRWLVLNKIDLLTDKDAIRARKEILDELAWDGPVFDTSAVSGDGTEKLAQAIMRELERTSEKI